MNTWINLTALWKIVVIGLAAGAGLPAVFAIGLRALNPRSATTAPAESGAGAGAGGTAAPAAGANPAGMVIAVICFAGVLAAVGWGIYSIVNGS